MCITPAAPGVCATLSSHTALNALGAASCRMLAGLWPIPDGSVHRPGSDMVVAGQRPAVYYVPQRPYTTPGSLRDQVLYPLSMAQVRITRGRGGGSWGGMSGQIWQAEVCCCLVAAATHCCSLAQPSCATNDAVFHMHCVTLSCPCISSQVMAPRYAAGSGRDELDAELMELMGVVRLK